MLKVRIFAVLLIILCLLSGYFVWNTEFGLESSNYKFKLGLDLDGGTHLTYGADTSAVNPLEIDDSMNSLRQTIERRINIFGVSEPIVQVEKGGLFSDDANQNRLIVELPGVTDVAEAIKQIGATPVLEFKLAKDESEIQELINKSNESGEGVTLDANSLYEPTGLTGAQLERSTLVFDQFSRQPTIELNYNDDGTKLLSEITSKNTGRIMAIFLDGNIISSPVIRDSIDNGQAVITGDFTAEEARELVRNLNFGALPVPIELIETQTIGATLGQETLNSGIVAFVVGFVIIFAFMLLWYRVPGLISIIALIFYAILMLSLFKLIPVTLTAAGLAGFILSIGMAVDANILIFERIKEELAKTSNLYDAIKIGSDRAWSSIRDGNLTSIISAVVLYWMSGTSLVQGFALVFGIGVVVSMFTAITVSKFLLLAISSKREIAPNSFYRKLFGSGFNFKSNFNKNN